MAEVPRVVLRLLQRAEDERREGFLPAPRLRDVLARSACSSVPRDGQPLPAVRCSGTGGAGTSRASSFARGARSTAASGRSCTRKSASRRRPASSSATASFARIISSSTTACATRLASRSRRASDATLSVELEGDLAGLDTQRATPIAPRAQLVRELLRQTEGVSRPRLQRLAAGENRFRLRVGQALAAPDHAPVEERLARLERGPKGISTVRQLRSRSGTRLQRPAESSSGSIGSTRPGT